MRHNYSASHGNVTLFPLTQSDSGMLRVWRNRAENSRFLRKLPHISAAMQDEWFNNYLVNADEYVFSIVESDSLKQVVGSLALYNFSDTSCELGKIMVGHDNAHGKKVGLNAVISALKVAFIHMEMEKVVLHVQVANVPAIRVYEQAGFARVAEGLDSDGKEEYTYAIDKKDFMSLYFSLDNARLIEFRQFGDERGHLVIAEGGGENIPFDIRRVFYIYGSDRDVVRGEHANSRTEFVLINVAGTSKVKVSDGLGGEKIFSLDRPHIGVYLPVMVWKEMYDFSEDSVLLVLASEHYDAEEYIRDHDAYVKKMSSLAGSAKGEKQ